MMPGHVLVVLFGLPGSGKTKLSRFLRSRLSDSSYCSQEGKTFKLILVSYDHLMPATLEHDLISGKSAQNKGKESRWKLFRQDIEEGVDTIIRLIKADASSDVPVNDAAMANRETIVKTILRDSDIMQSELSSLGDTNTFVIVIDDNMYFKSMRYSYYKLAREHNIGYCQVFVKTRLDLALQRNKLRENSVVEQVLVRMAEKFEAPLNCNSWEANSCILENDTDFFLSTWDRILAVLMTAMKHPVAPLEDDNAMQVASRKECLESIIHQSDVILRKLVSDTMKGLLKGDKTSKTNLKSEAEKLNGVRHQVMADIKNGDLTIPTHLTDGIIEGNLSFVFSDLESFLKTAFNDKAIL